MSEANVCEVFSGIQGEGLHVGRRHLFVRFGGCNLSCRYCDTPEARRPAERAWLERRPGEREFDELPNPLAVDELAGRLLALDADLPHHAISLTGGEPLLQADCIASLVARCPGRRFHLETNGTLPDELAKVIDDVHAVAMDIKLQSAAGCEAEPGAWRRFLRLAARREVFVKVVVSRSTEPGAIAEAASLIASVGRDIPLVVQPVTPGFGGVERPDPLQLVRFQTIALDVLDDVRVIPQTHKIIGQK
ncbi:MAG: 7-carboxy-7-deazaguanine synthase QueE [Planctomycetota bacterium]